VARLADGFHFIGTVEAYAEYAEAMRRHGRDPLSIPVYDSRECWAAENSEQAWQEAREHLFYSYSRYAAWDAAADAADGRPPAEAPAATPEGMRARGGTMLFVGDPGEITAMFRRRLQEVPLTGTIMRLPPGMEHRKVLRFMELIAREVMPHFADKSGA
jgi:alkanesulfonate monooxygenase SsuD/methylene tetrahydromethanopterin reductase-like flavin-dependent oxidoreductase (luciferase family)